MCPYRLDVVGDVEGDIGRDSDDHCGQPVTQRPRAITASRSRSSFSTTRSACFPGSREPTRSVIPSSRAGVPDAARQASSIGTPLPADDWAALDLAAVGGTETRQPVAEAG